MAVETINNQEELRAAIAKGTVVVDFFATWCGPCKMLSPVLEEVAEEKNVRIIKADIDEVKDIVEEYGIMSVPTVVKMTDGKVVEKSVGFLPSEALIDVLKL